MSKINFNKTTIKSIITLLRGVIYFLQKSLEKQEIQDSKNDAAALAADLSNTELEMNFEEESTVNSQS